MLGHEVVEKLLQFLRRMLSFRMLVQQVVEVVEHVVHALAVLVGRVGQRLLHPGEALVEHLAAQQVFDLLVLLPGLFRAPVVVGELLNRLGR